MQAYQAEKDKTERFISEPGPVAAVQPQKHAAPAATAAAAEAAAQHGLLALCGPWHQHSAEEQEAASWAWGRGAAPTETVFAMRGGAEFTRAELSCLEYGLLNDEVINAFFHNGMFNVSGP
jgi:hypothetical protein